MEIVSAMALRALEKHNYGELSIYQDLLSGIYNTHIPPYGEQIFQREYFRMIRDPGWFASLLVSDADIEGYSAGRLWTYASTVPDTHFAKEIQRHALDEARHSKLFSRMVLRLFPSLDEKDLREKLDAMSPELPPDTPEASEESRRGSFEEILNSAILLNIYEVKALVMLELLRPALLAYCEPSDQSWGKRVMSVLVADEARHIGYTARFINAAAANGYRSYISDAMEDFQRALNDVSWLELEDTITEFDETSEEFEALIKR